MDWRVEEAAVVGDPCLSLSRFLEGVRRVRSVLDGGVEVVLGRS